MFTGADTLAGLNVMAIVLEFPAEDIGAEVFQTWAVTSVFEEGGTGTDTTTTAGTTTGTTSGG